MLIQHYNIGFGAKIRKTPALEEYMSSMGKSSLLELKASIRNLGNVAKDEIIELQSHKVGCNEEFSLVNIKNNASMYIVPAGLSSALKELSDSNSKLHYEMFNNKTHEEIKKDIFDLLV